MCTHVHCVRVCAYVYVCSVGECAHMCGCVRTYVCMQCLHVQHSKLRAAGTSILEVGRGCLLQLTQPGAASYCPQLETGPSQCRLKGAETDPVRERNTRTTGALF